MEKQTKRKRYLIRPGFQLRWTLIITLAGTVTATIFSAGLWFSLDRQADLLRQLNETDQQLTTKSQDLLMVLYNLMDTSEKKKDEYIKQVEELDRKFERNRSEKLRLMEQIRAGRYLLIALVVAIGAGLFAWGIFLTHRVAGPLYVIRNQLEQLEAEGRVPSRPLRKKDEFKDDYAAISEILARLSGKSPQDT